MSFTGESVKEVLQHLQANHKQALWRVETITYKPE